MIKLVKKLSKIFAFILFLQAFNSSANLPTTCPVMAKRNNGNGNSSTCAALYGNPVATNVVGTSYASILTTNGLTASNKTGNFTLVWFGVIITEAPVITRVWVGGTLTNTVVGPPSPIRVNNGNSYVDYCYYRYNLPNQGTLTLEFANPKTGAPLFLCCFDLQTSASCTPAVSCVPTITTQPANQYLCGQSSTFVFVTATGATSYAWQYQAPGTSTWTSTSSIANFVGTTNDTLTINSVNSYNGYKFRCSVTNSGSGCGTVVTSEATINAYPKPTATFAAGSYVCGPRSLNLQLTLTGTPPWNFTYTTTPPGSSTTVSNISSTPYYLAVNPSVTTTYEITGINDKYCTNTYASGSVKIIIQEVPTISLTSSSISTCYGSGSASLAYTGTTNSPNQYSITTGTRAVAGFSAVTNASLSGSPIVITLPASTPTGTYDFNLTVKNSTSGCVSATVPFTITVLPKPDIAVSSTATSVCSGSSVTLTVAPTNLSSYSWSSTPAGASGSGTTLTANPTTNTTYKVIATDANGCKDTAQASVTIKSSGSLSVNSATICAGKSTTLTVSGASTYNWTPITGLSTSEGSTVIATPSATTTYTINATFSNGCTGSTTSTVTVNSAPSVSISSARKVCQGSGVTLTASGASTYQWTPTSTLSASTGSSVTATPTTTTIYTVYGTDANGCVGSDTQKIWVVASPISSSTGANYYYCQNDGSLTLSISTSSSSAFVWWSGTSTSSYPNYRNGTSTNYTSSPTDSTTTATTSTMQLGTPKNNDQFYQVIVKNGGCRFKFDMALQQFNNGGSTVVPSIISDQTYCGSSTATALSLNGTTNASYGPQWQSSSSSGGTYTNISGATALTYSPGTVSTSTWYKLILSPGGSCGGPYTSNSVAITINSALTSNTLSASNCITAATTITGSTPSGGTGTYTYLWESSPDNSTWSEIAGATSKDYTAPMTTTRTYYRRTVTSGACTSTSSSISISPAIVGNQISPNQSLCAGNSAASLAVGTLSGGTGTYTYRWQSAPDVSGSPGSWTNIVGASGAASTYSPGTPASTTWYRLLDTSGTCTAISNTVKLTVNALPSLSLTPSATTVCAGSTATLTAAANQGSTFSWSTNLGSGSLSATTGSVVTITPTATTSYTVTATDTNGCQIGATQVITYKSLPAAPTLSAGSASVCNPPTTSYSLTGLISSGPPSGVTYKWYTVSSNPSATYEISPATVSSSGTYYAYAFENPPGCYSAAASATITFVDVATPTPLTANVVLCDPLRADLTTYQPDAATGTTLEWHTVSSSPNGGTIVNPATSVGTVGATNTYYLYAKSTSLGCYSNASTAVTVTINPRPTASVTSTSAAVCSPGTIDLMNAIVSPVGTSTYQWYTSRTNPTPANMVENPIAVGTAGKYYLFVTDNNNCRSLATDSITLTVNTAPTLSVANTTSICEGTADTFYATASGSPTYQWYMLNTSTSVVTTLSNGGVYSGVTSDKLIISNTTGLGSNLYYVTATSSGCSTTSDYSALQLMENTVSTTTGPSNVSVSSYPSGATFTYTSSTANVNYYWQVYNGHFWRTIGTTGNDPTLYANYTTNRLEILTVNDSMNNFKYICQAGNNCDTASAFAFLYTPVSLNLSLFQLNAQASDSYVKLTWYSAGEDKIEYYVPEYSLNGNQFIQTAMVAKKASSGLNVYTLILKRENTTVYYRIKAVGSTGYDEYSNVMVVGSAKSGKLTLAPNPVSVEGSNAIFSLNYDRETDAEVKIFNPEGKLIQNTTMQLGIGSKPFVLNEVASMQGFVLVQVILADTGERKSYKLLLTK